MLYVLKRLASSMMCDPPHCDFWWELSNSYQFWRGFFRSSSLLLESPDHPGELM